jgi:hypothetical protein
MTSALSSSRGDYFFFAPPLRLAFFFVAFFFGAFAVVAFAVVAFVFVAFLAVFDFLAPSEPFALLGTMPSPIATAPATRSRAARRPELNAPRFARFVFPTFFEAETFLFVPVATPTPIGPLMKGL